MSRPRSPPHHPRPETAAPRLIPGIPTPTSPKPAPLFLVNAIIPMPPRLHVNAAPACPSPPCIHPHRIIPPPFIYPRSSPFLFLRVALQAQFPIFSAICASSSSSYGILPCFQHQNPLPFNSRAWIKGCAPSASFPRALPARPFNPNPHCCCVFLPCAAPPSRPVAPLRLLLLPVPPYVLLPSAATPVSSPSSCVSVRVHLHCDTLVPLCVYVTKSLTPAVFILPSGSGVPLAVDQLECPSRTCSAQMRIRIWSWRDTGVFIHSLLPYSPCDRVHLPYHYSRQPSRWHGSSAALQEHSGAARPPSVTTRSSSPVSTSALSVRTRRRVACTTSPPRRLASIPSPPHLMNIHARPFPAHRVPLTLAPGAPPDCIHRSVRSPPSTAL
ncbi:hypothetical protein B0H14DRAFT_3448998 [Mycena olivaceomarginata]|nr:hypothetical protein B0H14DRAFT_3448998 [Mycena olivaceomarginata]